MAQSVHIILTDDIDGTEAAETLRFSLDGTDYEIDLNTEHAGKLRSALDPYRTAARRTSQRSNGARSSRPTGKNSETPKIRAWAKENGYDISDRARIRQYIIDAYHAAQK